MGLSSRILTSKDKGDNMKQVTPVLAALLLAGCARTTFHIMDYDTDGHLKADKHRTENVGLVYYEAVPHLLVTRPLNKDGATTTRIVYLPDRAHPMSMKFHSGWGSSRMGVTLANGMLVSFNQNIDSKIPELLGSLTAPVTGLATAAASTAAAGLSDAEAEKIRAEIGTPGDGAEAAGTTTGFQVYTPDDCPPTSSSLLPIDEPSEDLSRNQVVLLSQAAYQFGCLAIDTELERLGDWSEQARRAAMQIQFVASQDYSTILNMIPALRTLPGDPLANSLRATVAEFKKFAGDGEPAKALADRIKTARALVEKVADEIDPPKSTKPPPAELYRIKFGADGKTYLEAVTDKATIQAAASPEPDASPEPNANSKPEPGPR